MSSECLDDGKKRRVKLPRWFPHAASPVLSCLVPQVDLWQVRSTRMNPAFIHSLCVSVTVRANLFVSPWQKTDLHILTMSSLHFCLKRIAGGFICFVFFKYYNDGLALLKSYQHRYAIRYCSTAKVNYPSAVSSCAKGVGNALMWSGKCCDTVGLPRASGCLPVKEELTITQRQNVP